MDKAPRGRQPTPAPEVTRTPELDGELLGQDLARLDTIEQGYAAERDLANQLLGQIQTADAFAQFSRTVSTSKLAYVKETKAYRALAGKKSADGQQFSGTWEEFCGLLGRSQQHVDEDIRNLRALGEEALESMSRMGIGYRELRQYRRLPDDSREALIEAARSGDKETLLDLAEELIARQQREVAELATQLEDARADIAAKDERAEKREREIERLGKDLAASRHLRERATPEETAEVLRNRAGLAAMQVRVDLCATSEEADSLYARFAALRAHAVETGNGDEHDAYMAGLVHEVMTELLRVRDAFALPILTDADAPERVRGA